MLTAEHIEYDIFEEIALPCESNFHEAVKHSDAAEFYISSSCADCSHEYRYFIGEQCFSLGYHSYLTCNDCGEVKLGKEFWTILKII